jgi:hypothetical protein
MDQAHQGIFEADAATGACVPGAAAAEVCVPGAVTACVCEPGVVAPGTVDGSAEAKTVTTKRANIKGTATTTKHFDNRFDRVTLFPSFFYFDQIFCYPGIPKIPL